MMMKPSPAGRLERLLANIVDGLVMLLPMAALIKLGGEGSALAILGGFACTAAYYVLCTSSNWQATAGKRLMGIVVIRRDGMLLTPRDALERFLAYSIPTLPLYLSIASPSVLGTVTVWLSLAWFMPILLRDDRCGVHDILCGTQVVVGKR